MTFRQLLKDGFEVRGADCVNAEMTGALAALWRGLLYDKGAMDEAERLLPKLSHAEHLAFHATAREKGLAGRLGTQELHRLAAEMVAIARRGLERLDPADAPLLAPLAAQAASGHSPAQAVLDAWTREQNPVALLARCAL